MLLFTVLVSLRAASPAQIPPWEVMVVPASRCGCMLGVPIEQVSLIACRARCAPIPWQLDERGVDGDLIFDGGDLAAADEPAGIVDGNDELVFMAEDGGREAAGDELPAGPCRVPLRLRRGEDARWVYVVAGAAAARGVRAYVRYDPDQDLLIGDGIALGFRDRIPQTLAVPGPNGATVNLLDRLKVRASARFLGLIPVRRDEGDLEAAAVGWRAGPVRVVRRQRQRIRVGWGIKSPRFTIDTYFYRSSAMMPLVFRLNFPPTYFFSRIAVETVLDFRDLRGWVMRTPSAPPLTIGSPARGLDDGQAEWFALIGPHVQLVQLFEVSPSLAPLDKRLAFRATSAEHPPEAVAGEMPGIGYRLRGWGRVDRGVHAFTAVNYVLPREQDAAAFVRDRARRIQLDVDPPLPPGR